MIIFKRDIEEKIKKFLFKRSIIIMLGPRQSGKTTLSKKLINEFGSGAEYYDCQLADVRKHFVVGRPELLLPITKNKKLVVFDEAQTIQNIGTILKTFHDHYPKTQIIATGSSSFDLANKIKESMTGRAIEFYLLPLSLNEIRSVKEINKRDLYDIMLYGSYPEVIASKNLELKEIAIKKIATNYLYKDVFVFEAIRNPKVFEDLIKLLAYQTGNIVSINELSISLGISRSVVQKYIRLLEQSYIIKVIHSFSNNPRVELKKAFKVYFVDLGVRNTLTGFGEKLENRPDKGFIFENFFMSELMKKNTLKTFPSEIMFWRTKEKLEIDFIEKEGNNIKATECKWQSERISSKENMKKFLKKYPTAKTSIFTVDSFL